MADDNPNAKQHHKKQRAFLAAYAECGNITKAAEIAEINRASHYDWMNDDPDYPELFKAADEAAGDKLEQEARRRAVEGTKKPVFYKGAVCGTVTEYSDLLLMFLLKGVRPDKFAERIKQDVNVKTDLAEQLRAARERAKNAEKANTD
jgi:hypothetical protein